VLQKTRLLLGLLMNYADLALGTWHPRAAKQIVEGMVRLAEEQGVEPGNEEVTEIVVENAVALAFALRPMVSRPMPWWPGPTTTFTEQQVLKPEYRYYDEKIHVPWSVEPVVLPR
jgi:hypothetical protein